MGEGRDLPVHWESIPGRGGPRAIFRRLWVQRLKLIEIDDLSLLDSIIWVGGNGEAFSRACLRCRHGV